MIRLTNGLLGLLSLLVFALVPSTASAQSPCHLLTSADPIPQNFGAAYNLFSPTKELLLRVDCGPASTATLQVGHGEDRLYIYKTAYEWTGSSWRKLALSGQNLVGDWYLGSAATNLIPSEAQLAEENYVVAYTCLRSGSEWKCGCRDTSCSRNHWQLQAFTYAPPPLLSGPGDDDDGASGSDLDRQYADLYDENLPYNGLFYGFPFSFDNISQMRIGGSEYGNRSLRFRAERSGSVSYVRYHNRHNVGSQSGYSIGDGGLIHAELRPDDGSVKHAPANTVLAKTQSYVPLQHGNGNSFIQLNFTPKVPIEAGKLYHIVLVNTKSKYASTNGARMDSGISDPVFGPYWTNDNATFQSPGGDWKFSGITRTPRQYTQPYASIGYTDGVEVGTGGWGYSRNNANIGGSSRVREVFTVKGPTRRVNGVWFRVLRKSGGTLTIQVKNSSGSVLLTKSVSGPNGWTYLDFGTALTLQSGATYSIEASGSTGGGYTMHASLDLTNWFGLKDRNMWSEGKGEVSANGGSSWSGSLDTGNFDFGFFFTLEGGPKSIQSIASFNGGV